MRKPDGHTSGPRAHFTCENRVTVVNSVWVLGFNFHPPLRGHVEAAGRLREAEHAHREQGFVVHQARGVVVLGRSQVCYVSVVDTFKGSVKLKIHQVKLETCERFRERFRGFRAIKSSKVCTSQGEKALRHIRRVEGDRLSS